MENAHLYLLVDTTHTKFKIGITIDIKDRSVGLERLAGGIDLDASYEVSDDLLSITRLEKTLHFIFRAWNSPSVAKHPGFTEWFDIGCLPDVIIEIERIGRYQKASRILKKGILHKRENRALNSGERSRIAALLFPEYRYRVLKLLFQNPHESHHVRELARLTGTVAGTVNRELRALAKAGLLQVERSGNHLAYSANRSSEVFDDIQRLVEKV
jgi:predicted transcriptional regulator